jgi:plastocyanin
MQRILASLLLIPAAAMLSGLAGCGKEEKPKTPSTLPKLASGDSGGKSSGGGPKKSIEPGKAKLIGRVVLDGDLPKAASLEPVMLENKTDGKFCLMGSEHEKIEQTWLIGKDKGVANVAIWLNPPDGAEFKVVEDKSDAVIDQPHCVYIPHVLAVKPGQVLTIKNSASVNHNTKLDVDELVNKKFGQTIPPNGSAKHELKPQSGPVNVACDFHGWMKAKIWVLPHQYVAVTKDDGTFTIENVPEGVEVSLVAWHEGASPSAFFGEGGKKGKKYTFKAGDNQIDLKVK